MVILYPLGLGLAIAAAIVLTNRYRRHRARREEASDVASELVPEIRSLLSACDSAGPTGGTPPPAAHYPLVRQRLPRILPDETLFAVETFYQSIEAYRAADGEMREAFAEGSALGLGDKIRAKDRRDRALKDVFYTGEAAIERLSQRAEGPKRFG